jgi:hypothetical protein
VTEHGVFPVWVFRAASEVGGDCALWYNNFSRPCLKRRQRVEVEAIVNRLRRQIRDGHFPPGRAVVGWPGRAGLRPPNGVDTNDAAAMRPWFRKAFTLVMTPDELADPNAVADLLMKGRRRYG